MCGIAGIVDFSGRPIAPTDLERAVESLKHRGPDDSGVLARTDGGLAVGLAATRLAILDISPAGHQPMVRCDGRYTLVFNGLIYNHAEIDRELGEGLWQRASRCDTETVLAACARWGPDALARFNGPFALAYYDSLKREGFIARDRFGIKPLVWTEHDGRMLFASEMLALHTLGQWSRDVHLSDLIHYLRFGFVVHPRTIYANVRRLSPGKFFRFDADGVENPETYCASATAAPTKLLTDWSEAASRIRRAMRESVSRRRLADVPLGAFLSGGLDSSIIVAHLAELSSKPVETFAVGWADQNAYDETRYARMVAERFGTHHHEIRFRFSDVLDILPDTLDHLGEPFFDSSVLPAALVSRFARERVTVCLSGDGGDELFGGYWRYQAHGMYERYARLPGLLRHGLLEPLMRRAAVSKSSSWANRVRQFRKMTRCVSDDPLRRHIAWSEILSPEARDLCTRWPDGDPVLDRIAADTSALDPSDALNRIMLFDLGYSLPADMLQKVDLAAMYHGLDVRVPFLDPEVVALARAIPSSMKVGGGDGKIVLKEAYRNMLPEEVLSRPKAGFEVPVGEFLRHDLRDIFMDTVSEATISQFGFLRHDAIMDIYAQHCDRRGEHADLLFALLSLCWWARRYGVGNVTDDAGT